ncbi:hypothetical protein ACX0GZ_08275 [Sphingomonas aestuarii]
MPSPRVTDSDQPTDEEVEAAARQLHLSGVKHGWWPESVSNYDSLEPIGKDEFDAIVECILTAAAAAKREIASGSE